MKGMSEGEMEMNIFDLANKLVKLQRRVEDVEYKIKEHKIEIADLQLRTMNTANNLYK